MSLRSASPRRLGRYEVIGLLATGGMAEVHLGRLIGPSGFERVVVLKRILPHLARELDFVNMFLDEARIVAKLDHPNVVHVIELGRDGDELFLAMELVEGESLGSFMRRHWSVGRAIGIDLASYIVSQACAGLHAAHTLADESGRPLEIVHRDVSPQNLMIAFTGRIKILDFGIAKAVGRATRTETGELKGKVEYMSPEQCRGAAVDRRTDVFALGVLLYELTVGKRLFRRDNQVASMRAVCDEPIPRPETELSGYPPALAAIVMRALARDREQRYESAEALRLDLVGFLRASPNMGLFEDLLAERMRELFADRLSHKREMLRAARDGASLGSLPKAEVDQEVEPPVVATVPGRGTPVQLATAASTSPGAPRWRAPFAAALLVGGLGGGGLFWAARRAAPAAPAPAAPQVSALPSAQAPAGPEVVPSGPSVSPATSASVTIDLATTPPGARIRIGDAAYGVTPQKVALARGSAPLTVTLELEGYAPLTRAITPDVDQRLALDLRPASKVGPRGGPRPPATVAPTATGSPYRKFN